MQGHQEVLWAYGLVGLTGTGFIRLAEPARLAGLAEPADIAVGTNHQKHRQCT
jgi:hypothetical protein